MAVEIPVRRKHIAGKGMYGYKRNHNGNGTRAKRTGFGNGYSDPYVRENHVLWLCDGRRRVWEHKR